MKSKDDSLKWLPLWIDKWIFGSTRLELQHDERAIWVDLMALAGKDNGYIRANTVTAYPMPQLAGLLCCTEELLLRALKRCLETNKIAEIQPGIFYLLNWKEFQLSERQRQRIEQHARENVLNQIQMSSKTAPMTELDAISSNSPALNIEKRTQTLMPPVRILSAGSSGRLRFWEVSATMTSHQTLSTQTSQET